VVSNIIPIFALFNQTNIIMKKVNTLLLKVKNLIANNEYNLVKLHGVSCSRADLDMIQMYCEMLLRGESLSNKIIFGEAKQVFDKVGIDYK